MKRKLKINYTCSDFVKHEHKYKWTAWLCGKIQYWSMILRCYF